MNVVRAITVSLLSTWGLFGPIPLEARSSEGSADRLEQDQMAPVVNSIGMKLVCVPAGQFCIGSTPIVDPHDDFFHCRAYMDEEPRTVRIGPNFYIGKFEVTQRQYRKIMDENPSYFSTTGLAREAVQGMRTGNFPVENVSWHHATVFCRRLSRLKAEKKAGRRYRLPTSDEWEVACRAGSRTPFAIGNGVELASTLANFDGFYPYGKAPQGPWLARPTTVGSYRTAKNAFGMYDVHGNVWEWCQDGPTLLTRYIRGGSWYSEGHFCRSSDRPDIHVERRSSATGFRVVMTINES
jgi:formylglycine-generating enzyme required for sulfatase activity